MTALPPPPECVTLTDEEKAALGDTLIEWHEDACDGECIVPVVEGILAAREQALREEVKADLMTDEAVAELIQVANDADRDYSALEWSADAGRKQDEPGDWFAFITKRVATAAAARIARGGAR